MNRSRKRTKHVIFFILIFMSANMLHIRRKWLPSITIATAAGVNVGCLKLLIYLFYFFFIFALLFGIDSIFDNLHASRMSRPKQRIRINDVSEFHELINAEHTTVNTHYIILPNEMFPSILILRT